MQPNKHQLDAIKAFAERNGRCWKDRLRKLWLLDVPSRNVEDSLLRQVRNQCGPEWLSKFKLGAS